MVRWWMCLQGQVSDIAIHAQEILRMRSTLNEIYASHTGQPVDVIGKPQKFSFGRVVDAVTAWLLGGCKTVW